MQHWFDITELLQDRRCLHIYLTDISITCARLLLSLADVSQISGCTETERILSTIDERRLVTEDKVKCESYKLVAFVFNCFHLQGGWREGLTGMCLLDCFSSLQPQTWSYSLRTVWFQ